MQHSGAPSSSQDEDYEGFSLEKYKSMWREAVDLYSDARQQHFRDEEYYDGDVKGTGWGHWTEGQLRKLGMRNQPPTTRNLIQRKVDGIAGVEQRTRTEPRAQPRTPKDQKAAEIATDALRFIKEKTRWSNIKADKTLEALKIGFAAVEIGGAPDCVPITPINWKDFVFDPRSRMPDFSDARYLGVAKWVDKDVALATYVPPVPNEPQIPPKPVEPAMLRMWADVAQQTIEEYKRALQEHERIKAVIEETVSGGGTIATGNESDFEDRPASVWCDQKRERIFIVDLWHRDPKKGWFRCVFTGQGKLFTEEASLIEIDQWGRKQRTHPIVAMSIRVSKDLWRYGEVRGMRSPQDEVNFRLSKALHLIAVNQIVNRTGNLPEEGKETLRNEASRPDGYLEVPDPGALRIEKNMDLAAGQQRLGEDARAFLELAGPNPQLQGEQGRATSGRAVLALQQAGLGQLGPIFDRIHDWETRCYRAMWARVQQFWTAPMYVRVTDDKNAAKFAAINGAPVIMDHNGMQPTGPEPGAMLGHNGGPMGDPLGPQEVGPMLAELDMDIVIDRAPEAATLQAEQFESAVQLAQAGVLGPPGPEIGRLLVTWSSAPNKSELLEMLDKMAQEQKPNPQQMGELKKLAAQIEQLMAQRDKTRAETAKISSEIPKTQAETERTHAEARTKNAEATMTEFNAGVAHGMAGLSQEWNGAGMDSLNINPTAAGPSGVIGLPPQTANGPPPF